MVKWMSGERGGSQQKQNHRLNRTESEFVAKFKKPPTLVQNPVGVQ